MTTFDHEPERVDSDSPSESENLADVSLSAYDCDSEGVDGINDDDSDSEMEGIHKPGMTNLKFQLDAAKGGQCHAFPPLDPAVDQIAQPGIASMKPTWTTSVHSIFTSAREPPIHTMKNFVIPSRTR